MFWFLLDFTISLYDDKYLSSARQQAILISSNVHQNLPVPKSPGSRSQQFVLTHDTKFHSVAFSITLDVRCDAGVVARLLASHTLKCQRQIAHNDATLQFRLHRLALKYQQILQLLVDEIKYLFISAFFWDITQRRVVITCRRFGTINGSRFLDH